MILKNFGIDNLKLIGIISLVSLTISILLIALFYNFSAKLKHIHLDIKNDFANDNKYLAVITNNGIWIKDEISDATNIINAANIEGNNLKNVIISQFDKNFIPIKYIYADKINIKNNNWRLSKAIIIENNMRSVSENYIFSSNFNSEKINSLFSNLDSLTIWELYKLKKDYETIGYSINDIELHLQKIFSFPIYLTILTIFASVLMLNVSANKPKIFYLLMGIFVSVLIFYVNHFSSLLGENNKLPITLSVWLPHLVISILTTIGMVRVNEK